MTRARGKWYSTPQVLRRRKVVGVTLSAPVVEALPELAGGKGSKSSYVERLIREDASSRGKPIAEE